MKSRLLGSFVTVVLFWWALSSFLFFFLSSPETAEEKLTKFESWAPWWFLTPDAVAKKVTILDLFGNLNNQVLILVEWIIPTLVIISTTAAIGYVLSWVFALWLKRKRELSEKGKGQWRGVDVTMGFIPEPDKLKKATIELKISKAMSNKIDALPEGGKALLHEILGTLAAYPEAFAGAGHGVGLLRHTLNVMQRSVKIEEQDPLLILAAATHDLGKITAFKKIGDDFVAIKNHDKESARLVALFDSWWKMDESEREVLRLAVKYSHAPSAVPKLPGVHPVRVVELIRQLKSCDGMATSAEKKKVLEKKNLEDLVVDAFLQKLPQIPFQVKGIPIGVKAAGWVRNGVIYLLEHRIREAVLEALDDDVYAAFGGGHRQGRHVTEVTQYLILGLDKRGWLVRGAKNKVIPSYEALWHITAGSHSFSGVLILKTPADVLALTPDKETLYDMYINCPQNKLEYTGDKRNPKIDEEFFQDGAVRNLEAEDAITSAEVGVTSFEIGKVSLENPAKKPPKKRTKKVVKPPAAKSKRGAKKPVSKETEKTHSISGSKVGSGSIFVSTEGGKATNRQKPKAQREQKAPIAEQPGDKQNHAKENESSSGYELSLLGKNDKAKANTSPTEANKKKSKAAVTKGQNLQKKHNIKGEKRIQSRRNEGKESSSLMNIELKHGKTNASSGKKREKTITPRQKSEKTISKPKGSMKKSGKLSSLTGSIIGAKQAERVKSKLDKKS